MAGYRVVGGGAAAPAGDADIIWTETPRYRDSLKPSIALPDKLVLRDVHAETVKLPETLRFVSTRVVPAITASYPEPLKYRDGCIGTLTELKVSRSGTPDADILGDGWVDGIPLNNGVNHGNESPLPTSGNLLAATTQFPYFKWNMTTPKFIGLAHRAGVGGCTFSFWASQGLAVVQTLNIWFKVFAANPFTESTLTYNNQPNMTTPNVTRASSILVGAVNGRYDITLTPTEFAPFIGNWMCIRMDSAAVAATPINIVSREGVIGERPLLTFDFKIA